jgi:predicted nucleic acid-binding Zn ribbon protein
MARVQPMHVCVVCKRSYIPFQDNQKYCSEKCRILRSPEALKDYLPRACEHCGDVYTPERKWQRFCRPQCAHEDWNEKNDPAQRMRDLRARRGRGIV